MDGFKNTTKTHYMKGGACEGYAKGGHVKGAAKIAKVMGEFKSGKLHSGSKEGPEVSNPKQAVAIALSEARKAGAKVPVKKADGGMVAAQLTATRGNQFAQAQQAAEARLAQAKAAQAASAARLAAMRQPGYRSPMLIKQAETEAALKNRAALQAASNARGQAATQRAMDEARARAAAAQAAPQVFTRTQNPNGTYGTATPVARKKGGAVKKADGGRVGGPTVDESGEERVKNLASKGDDFRKRKGLEVTKTTTVRTVPADNDSALSRRLSQLPSERGEMRGGKDGAGFRSIPLIGGALNALGLKKGGLSTMPRGKK